MERIGRDGKLAEQLTRSGLLDLEEARVPEGPVATSKAHSTVLAVYFSHSSQKNK